MAQGGIKKGFFFYFGLFVLLLISIFCICLVVMMFNPGSTVLWMKYFTDNKTFQIVETNDDLHQKIVWENVENLEINCGYANVVVERNADGELQKHSATALEQDGVYIVNNAKGFSVAAGSKMFSYSAYFEGNTLKIDIQEPTGFLYFSKDIRVILHASTTEMANPKNWDFSKINLKVNTKEGDVTIGGVKDNNAKEIKLASLDVSTTSGDIAMTEMFDMTKLGGELRLSTESGNLTSGRTVSFSGEQQNTGIALNCDSRFVINGNGKISYNVINAPGHNVNLSCKSGAWDIAYLNALKTTCTECYNGNYLFGTVYGDLFVDSPNSLVSPNIKIKKMEGEFALTTQPDNGSRPDVEIEEARGAVSINGDRGSLKIKKAHGAVSVESHDDMKVDVTFDDNASGPVLITTKKGSVRLAYLGKVQEGATAAGAVITTDSGKVTVDVTSSAKFEANMFVNDDQAEKTRIEYEKDGKVTGKITLNIGKEELEDLLEGETRNPLKVNQNAPGVNGSIEIVTNGKIEFNLKDKAELEA